jgi:hypothetical protein
MLRVVSLAIVFACSLAAQDRNPGLPTGRESRPASRPTTRKGGEFAVVEFNYRNAACPITSKRVNPEIFLKTAKGRIWFCCTECQEKARTDPDSAYAKAYPTTTQVKNEVDPVDGKPVKAGVAMLYQGYEINLSDPANARAVTENGDLYVALLTRPGLKDAKNTMDPITKGPVEPNMGIIIGDYLVRIGSSKSIQGAHMRPQQLLRMALEGKNRGKSSDNR